MPGKGKPFQKGSDPRRRQDKPLSAEAQKAVGQSCPQCGHGHLAVKRSQYGEFVACDQFPRCTFRFRDIRSNNDGQGETGETKTGEQQPPRQEAGSGKDAEGEGQQSQGEGQGDQQEGEGEGDGEGQGEGEGEGNPDNCPQCGEGAPLWQKELGLCQHGLNDKPEGATEKHIAHIAGRVAAGVAGGLDKALEKRLEAKLAKVAKQAAAAAVKAGAGTTEIVVKELGEDGEVKSERKAGDGKAHAMLQEIVSLLKLGLNVALVGPAGCGKTTLGKQAADVLQADFEAQSLSGGVTESKLVGLRMPSHTGSEYLGTRFVKLFEEGGVWLGDEVDAADANVLLALNSALANGRISLPARVENPVALRHGSFHAIVALNTWGRGADRVYVGRNQLDGAFLDRFVGATIELDYDHGVETTLCPDKELREKLWAVRAAVREKQMNRVLSTRALENGYKIKRGLGLTTAATVKRLLAGWSKDELHKVGVAA